MLDILKNYLEIFLHPIAGHESQFEHRREVAHMRKNRIFSIVDEDQNQNSRLAFSDFAMVSWCFVMVSAFYSLAFMLLGTALANSNYFSTLKFFPNFSYGAVTQKKIFLVTLLFEVVFFPLAAWLYVKFWRVIISLFANLFDREVDPDALDDVVNAALVGNSFLLIPIIGKLFKSFAQVYYIFLGVKYNLRFTTTQSFLIIVSPLLFIAVFILFIFMYIMLMVNMLQ